MAAGVLFCVLTGATAASAHATLVSTSPADGSVAARSPGQVVLTFDQPVTVSAGSVAVFTPGGVRADTAQLEQTAGGTRLGIGLRTGLGNGTYTVTWRIVSADSHPVSGAFTFSVGAPSSTVVRPHAPGGRGTVVPVAFAFVRSLAFAAYALLVGAVAFVIVCWPAGLGHRAVARLITSAWAGSVAATVGTLLLQGPYSGQSAVSVHVLRATLATRLGRALEVRMFLLAVVAVLLAEGSRRLGRSTNPALAATWAVLSIALAATWSTADHAVVGTQLPFVLTADVAHLVAMAVWAGGLVVLAGVLLRRGADVDEAAVAVPRFSAIALGCVTVLVASGVYEAWRNVGGLSALEDTTYGRLLLFKSAGTIVLIALGYLARVRIRQARASPIPVAALVTAGGPPPTAIRDAEPPVVGDADPPSAMTADAGSLLPRVGRQVRGGASAGVPGPLRRLRISVAVEVAIVVVVLAASALLVETPTGRESYRPAAHATVPFDTGAAGGAGHVRVSVTPARLGPNRILLTLLGPGGRPYSPAELTADLRLPARGLGPEPVRFGASGPGRYASTGAVITFTGRWRLQVTIRGDAWNETTVVVPVTVR